jgi:hypothetical protein
VKFVNTAERRLAPLKLVMINNCRALWNRCPLLRVGWFYEGEQKTQLWQHKQSMYDYFLGLYQAETRCKQPAG